MRPVMQDISSRLASRLGRLVLAADTPLWGEVGIEGRARAISTARFWCRHLYACGLSTSWSRTALREISSRGGLRA